MGGCGCKGDQLLQAIRDAINADTAAAREIVDALRRALQIAPEPTSVDVASDKTTDETKWGSIRETVNALVDTSLDFIQKIALSTNNADALGRLVESVPVAGDFIANIVNYVDWVADAARDSFDAHDSVSVRDDLACAIFCDLRSLDSWNYQQFHQALSRHLQQQVNVNLELIINILASALTGTLPPAETWAAIVWFCSSIVKEGHSVLGITIRDVKIRSNAGVPDDDYALCDCVENCVVDTYVDAPTAPPPYLTVRATTEQEYAAWSSAPLPIDAQWSDFGDGIQRLGSDVITPNYNGASRVICVKTFQFDTEREICSIKVAFKLWNNNSAGEFAVWLLNAAGERVWYDTINTYASEEIERTFYPNAVGNRIVIRLYKLYSGARVGLRYIEFKSS